MRQEKLGKGGRDVTITSETFRWSLVGSQSLPVEPGQQPEASLAWGGVSRTAKRRQPASTPSIEPREMLTRGEPSFSRTRGPRRPPSRPGVIGPAGVKEHGIGASRLPRNLGRPGLSAIHVRTGTRITNPRLAGYACWTGGSKPQAQIAVSRRECKRSDARRGPGNRSASYYRRSRGTLPEGTRPRKGGAGLRTRWRATRPVLRNRDPCSRNPNG